MDQTQKKICIVPYKKEVYLKMILFYLKFKNLMLKGDQHHYFLRIKYPKQYKVLNKNNNKINKEIIKRIRKVLIKI